MLIPLAEKISKKPSNDSVVWLLSFTLINMRNEEEQTKQGKIENVQFEVKRSTRKWDGAKSFVQGEKQMNESLMLNRIKGGENSGQDPTQLKF